MWELLTRMSVPSQALLKQIDFFEDQFDTVISPTLNDSPTQFTCEPTCYASLDLEILMMNPTNSGRFPQHLLREQAEMPRQTRAHDREWPPTGVHRGGEARRRDSCDDAGQERLHRQRDEHVTVLVESVPEVHRLPPATRGDDLPRPGALCVVDDCKAASHES